MQKYDIVIIGGGIIGASIAYHLSRYKLNILLLEKNAAFANETSKCNSGVIHGGFDAESHKSMARLNVLGNQLWVDEIFKYLKFPRIKIDSLVLAFENNETSHIDLLYQRGLQNGVGSENLKILNREEVLVREPNINPAVQKALLCTSSWAIDPVKATLAFLGAAKQNGVELRTNTNVQEITKTENFFTLKINNGIEILAHNIINAAGHYADVIAQKAKVDDFKQITRRGEYRILHEDQRKLINSVCFMVPTIHGKGVIVAPMLDGTVLVGPTAEENIAKEDTKLITRKMYAEIGKIGKKIVPNLNLERTITTFAGSRPIAVKTNDFIIGYSKYDKNFINAAGMQSPGLSAAPAIARKIEKLIIANFEKVEVKNDFNPYFEIFS